MRPILVSLSLVLLATATAVAQPASPKIAVLGLDTIGRVPHDIAIASQITDGMRAAARRFGPYVLAPDGDRMLADEKRAGGCAGEARACMAVIGTNLGADRLLYGRVHADRAGHRLRLSLLDVRTKSVVRVFSDVLPARPTPAAIDRFAKHAYRRVVDDRTAGTLAIHVAATAAVAVYLDGHHETDFTGDVLHLDVPAGTYELGLEARGHRAWKKLVTVTAGDEARVDAKLVRLITRPVPCDPSDAIARGNAHARAGRHAAALGAFENALACRVDPIVFAKAFAAACHSRNASMARSLYRRITPADRRRLVSICKRNDIDVTRATR